MGKATAWLTMAMAAGWMASEPRHGVYKWDTPGASTLSKKQQDRRKKKNKIAAKQRKLNKKKR